MVECHKCKARWPDGTESCPKDGTPLLSPDAATFVLRKRPKGVPPPSFSDEAPTEAVTALSIPVPPLEKETDKPHPFDPASLIGMKLGEYEVGAQLGQGGMGLVYRGVQPVIGKPVAIKVLRPELARDPEHIRRFLDEARAVNAVRHPGLVDIFSFGELPGGVAQYFVMELLEGESLSELMHRRKAMRVGEAVPLLVQMCDALAAVHAVGVIHRDLKPSNIFLVKLSDGKRLVKLLDFGLAKNTALNPGMSTQMALGTPEYMAPEQAMAQPMSPKTDLYCLGCVMYEMLTGKVPFWADSQIEIMRLQVTAKVVPPSQLDGAVTRDAEELVLQLLEKDPEKRPASAAEVKRALQRIGKRLLVATTNVRPSAPVPPAAPRTKRPSVIDSFIRFVKSLRGR